MPELPEVETVCRQLQPQVERRTVVSTWADDHRHQIDVHLAEGHTIRQLRRAGKYLLAELVGCSDTGVCHHLVIHLGMTGQLHIEDAVQPRGRHERARLQFDDTTVLVFDDVRRFGRFAVCRPDQHQQVSPTLANLGPDAHTNPPDARVLHAELSERDTTLKAALLGQRHVAGLGNIYVDEACHAARLRPDRRTNTLTEPEIRRLLQATSRLLKQAIAAGGTTFRDYRQADGSQGSNQQNLQVYGRAGQPCRSCETPLQSDTVAGRTTVWCPACQH